MQPSSRLTYRQLVASDHAIVYRQFSDYDMCRFFSEPACSWDEAAGIISHYAGPREDKTSARWGIFRAADGAFIGTCGYHFWDATQHQVEIGYDIWKDVWRHGYGSEAVGALIRHCRDVLAVTTIYALIHPANEASLALCRTHGFVASPLLRPCEDQPIVCVALHLL